MNKDTKKEINQLPSKVISNLSSFWIFILGAVLRIRDVYPGSWILIFTHPGSRIQKQQQKRGVKKLLSYLFLEPKIKQNWKLFYFWNSEEKNLGQFSKKYRTFNPKIVPELSKIWVWDPGSEIRDPEKIYSGSRGQKGTGSGAATVIGDNFQRTVPIAYGTFRIPFPAVSPWCRGSAQRPPRTWWGRGPPCSQYGGAGLTSANGRRRGSEINYENII